MNDLSQEYNVTTFAEVPEGLAKALIDSGRHPVLKEVVNPDRRGEEHERAVAVASGGAIMALDLSMYGYCPVLLIGLNKVIFSGLVHKKEWSAEDVEGLWNAPLQECTPTPSDTVH